MRRCDASERVKQADDLVSVAEFATGLPQAIEAGNEADMDQLRNDLYG